jgi:methylenetetrahydrofolate dehydrogenase (NADP+)/methenyltetrahydrofolate cyclohydrolase
VLHRHGYALAGRNVLVIGEGHLVGEPAAIWAAQLGANVTTVNASTVDMRDKLLTADVIISGAGVPGLVTPDMVKDGVILLDAGTSESEGVLKGDIDPLCADKAALYTPTPGGIGPITVAKVFENLVILAELKARRMK